MLDVARFTASAPDAFISRPSADGARDAALGIRFPPAGSKDSKRSYQEAFSLRV